MDENDTNNAAVSRKSVTPRPRKSWSLVWNDFTKERRADGSSVAICNHCKKQLTASSRSGTTHLKNHLIICTSERRIDGRKKRKKLVVRRPPALKSGDAKNDEEAATNLEQFKFDQELSRQDLARMIVLHRYPLSMVDDVGFKTFIRNLQPHFKLMSHDTVKEDCMKIYENARLSLYQVLGKLSCRVSLTLDTWGPCGELEYVCLTGHYIDNDWKLQRKILNLMNIEALSTSEVINSAVVEKIYDWNIHKKLSSMVLDNFSTYDEVTEELLKFLRPKDVLLSNGDFFHLHSCTHIFDLIIQHGLKQICDIMNRVRESVKYVKSSQLTWRRFQEVANQVHAPQKPLLLDVTTSWTSTYLMLTTACEFQDAFMHLAECDGENSHWLSSNEWDDVKAINECLDVFYQAMKKFLNIGVPTANLYFNDICSIHLLLKTWCISPFPVVVSMASQMLKKFEQHWEITRMVMAIASVLDPRYKMKSIEYFFKLIYDSEYEAVVRMEDIRKGLTNLYNEYLVHSTNTSSTQALLCYAGSSSGDNNTHPGTGGVVKTTSRITLSDARRGLDQYLQQSSTNQSIKSDLDMYLEEAVHPSKEGLDDIFDVLAWWKINAPKYPILSMMARDILATPMSLASLDIEIRSLHQYPSSMDPITLQSLVCAHDWLRDEIEAANLGGDVSMVPTNGDELGALSQ